MPRLSAAIVSGFLTLVMIPGAQSATDHQPTGPTRLQSDGAVTINVAATSTYMLLNIFPFPVDIRILGNGPSFPQVVRMPAAPAPPVPIPYPNLSMQIQIKKPTGGWSGKFTIKWKPGNLALPTF